MTCRPVLILLLSSSNVLEAVHDADLEKLIVNEKFVIALFIPSREYYIFQTPVYLLFEWILH
jgi:hypothetical protein